MIQSGWVGVLLACACALLLGCGGSGGSSSSGEAPPAPNVLAITIDNVSATNTGATGAPSGLVNFQIANANALFASGNAVFNNLGGPASGFFDWGLPFFPGRTVYISISGQNSVIGRGPFWAY